MNESQSPETEDKEDEEDAESDFLEDQVDVIKVTTDNGGDLEKKNSEEDRKKRQPLQRLRRQSGPGQQTLSQFPPKIASIWQWFR